MNYFEELKQAILYEDFYTTNEIIEKIKLESNAFEYVKPSVSYTHLTLPTILRV